MVRAIDVLAGNEFVNAFKSCFVQHIGWISGQGTDIGIMENAINLQPYPAAANITPVGARSVIWILLFARQFLEAVIVTRVIPDCIEIEQGDIFGEIFIQEEVIFANALKGQQGAVQQQILAVLKRFQCCI